MYDTFLCRRSKDNATATQFDLIIQENSQTGLQSHFPYVKETSL